MSTIPTIVSRTRSRKTPEGGGFSVKRINSTFNELSRDVQELQSVYNNTLRPLIAQLPLGTLDADNATDTPIGDALDAIKLGLSGDQVWTDNTATNKSSVLFWDGGRKLTIKETILKLAGQLDASINAINQAFFQFNNDPISDYTKAYIGLKAFDATATSGPGSMDAQLDAIRTFIGSDGVGDSTPDYTSLNYITQNTSLEVAISALDAAIASVSSSSYTADGLGIELSAGQFSLEIDVSGDTVLSKGALGITALNDDAWWNARKLQGVALQTPSTPSDGQALIYSNGNSQWEAQTLAYTTDHGALGGLGDDDHTQYLLVDGTRAMAADLDMGTYKVINVGLVDGVDVSDHDARHERAGADEIDGDHLDIDFTPSNYTPSTAPAEAAHVDDLAAHLAGIDNVLGAAPTPVGRSSDLISPWIMQSSGANPTDDKVTNGAGTPVGVIAARSKNFPADVDSFVTFIVGIPRDSLGANPATVRCVPVMLATGGGAGSKITSILSYSDSGGLDPIIDGEAFDFVNWSTQDVDTWTASTTLVRVWEATDETLGTSQTGYLHIQFGRLGSTGAFDDFSGALHLLGIRVEWTW